jgi:ribosomal protein S18 acetylase RimI-like enzyme
MTFLFFIQLIHSVEFINKSREIIHLELCQKEDLIECETLFIHAFSQAYEGFTPQELGVNDKIMFLKEAFSEVSDDLSLGIQTLVVAKIEGKIVGFIGFKKTEKPYEIYITQLAVDPNYWQQGIGRGLVFSILDLYKDVQSLVVIQRKINIIAHQFYQNLGFTESSYMHPGYNPERYIGYEWKNFSSE